MDAIAALFWDVRTVKTRSAYQLILEIPLEQADAALKLLGGTPVTGQERWVGIAPLASDGDRFAVTEKPGKIARPDSRPAPSEGERLRTQAVMLCEDERFHSWYFGAWPATIEDLKRRSPKERVADYIRQYCGIASRAELATNPEAQQKFRDLIAQYRAETGQMAERRGG
jgi:hypothetical protein